NFFFQAEDGIRDDLVTGVQTCALPISSQGGRAGWMPRLDSRQGHPRPRRLAVIRFEGSLRDTMEPNGRWPTSTVDSTRRGAVLRSEERRVGKECRGGSSGSDERKNGRE